MAAAALAAMMVAPVAQAGVNTDTLSIHFGANEPTQVNGSMLDPADVTGVPAVASANWNNVSTKGGVSTSLIRDTNGVATTTGATVLWEATNTWASTGKGEENNHFTGANATLMTVKKWKGKNGVSSFFACSAGRFPSIGWRKNELTPLFPTPLFPDTTFSRLLGRPLPVNWLAEK